MSDHQMPTRIWADPREDGQLWGIHGFSKPSVPNKVEFIRADLAARLAEAILASIDMIENCADAPKNPDSLPEMVKVQLQQALSAWKEGR